MEGNLEPNVTDSVRTADQLPRYSAVRQTAEMVLALIDSSRLRRECLKLALAQHNARWRVMDMATTGDALLLAEGGQHFDLVLVGAATAEHVDIEELEELRCNLPDSPIVVAAENDSPHRARLILKAGARGFLPTSLSLKVMMGALDLVMAGGVYVPSSLIEANQAPRPGAEPSPRSRGEALRDLTRRQRDVLSHISQGKSNKLIADALSMSESTVKAHVKQIIKRLHVANRTQAALLATGIGGFAGDRPAVAR
jgi:DNA-binding NarL/FixJ family response regulator